MLNRLFRKNKLANALWQDDLNLLLKAIRAGEDINAPLHLSADEIHARPAVEHALRREQAACLQKLLEAGALLPEEDNEGTLLLSVAINTHKDALSLTTHLLQAGANANANEGEPLFACLALDDDNLTMLLINRLLQYGADLNDYRRNDLSALALLICQERTMLVGTLISAGAVLPENLDLLACSDSIKQFAHRKASDIAIQKLFLAT
ncbi:MAG: hypothetical protein V7629_16350 [Motiliproteus sp.]